jgi:hypothetical protein
MAESAVFLHDCVDTIVGKATIAFRQRQGYFMTSHRGFERDFFLDIGLKPMACHIN